MNNKAVLLRSVSAIATAAASTAAGVQGVSAQVVEPGPNGYYYSVTGGFGLSPSESYLAEVEDKIGYEGDGYNNGYSGYSSFSNDYSSYTQWSTSGYSEGADLKDFAGLFGSVSVGKEVAPNWDIRGTISVVGGNTSGNAYARQRYSSYSWFSSFSLGSSFEGSSFYSGYSAAFMAGRETYGLFAADFEVGYTPVLSDSFNVRLFAGIRALAFQRTFEGERGYYESSNSSYSEWSTNTDWYEFGRSAGAYSSYFSGINKMEFKGIGPRVGIQASTRFEGTNFGLSGSLATSVLFGEKTYSVSGFQSWSSYSSSYWSGSNGSGSSYYNDSGSSYGSSSYSEKATVLDVQASVGLDYYLNDNTALTVGYQAEKLWEVEGESMGSGVDLLTHGAFVKLSGSF